MYNYDHIGTDINVVMGATATTVSNVFGWWLRTVSSTTSRKKILALLFTLWNLNKDFGCRFGTGSARFLEAVLSHQLFRPSPCPCTPNVLEVRFASGSGKFFRTRTPNLTANLDGPERERNLTFSSGSGTIGSVQVQFGFEL